MIMKKICLSIDQMRQLKELGVETKDASMCWVRDPEGKYTLSIHDEYCYEMSFMNPVPAFTLQDMIEMMPDRIYHGAYEFYFYILKNDMGYVVKYSCGSNLAIKFDRESILDAAFSMLVWLAKHGYLKGSRGSEEMKEQTGSTNASCKSQN